MCLLVVVFFFGFGFGLFGGVVCMCFCAPVCVAAAVRAFLLSQIDFIDFPLPNHIIHIPLAKKGITKILYIVARAF